VLSCNSLQELTGTDTQPELSGLLQLTVGSQGTDMQPELIDLLQLAAGTHGY
jgi:hypothetical protein